MNYSALTFFLHELSTMTLEPIKLPSYNTFPPFHQSKGLKLMVNRENFFFSFLPLLQITKMGEKIEKKKKKILSPVTVHLTDKMRKSVIRW
jgi:hypothetical protein